MSGRPTLVVATAGHIDHGKSSLVQALTGQDPDRLEEEKRRGITIALGFAHLDLEEKRIAFVDVPGHEKFVATMIGGAQGVSAGLLIVASDEAVMPQTREHFRILQTLQVPPGLILLTKSDLVEEDMLELAREDVAALVADTPWAEAPVIPCSAKSGEGLDQVKAALADLQPVGSSDMQQHQSFLLPLDRGFSLKGHGTVVTGTVQSGFLHKDQPACLFPGGQKVRIRSLQAQGEQQEQVERGQRAAINLGDVSADQVGPGSWLTGGEEPFAGTRLLAVRSSNAKTWPERVTVHVGTAKILGRCADMPGHEDLVLLRLNEPLLAFPGQRLVVRRPSPVDTLGGGVVLANRRPRSMSLQAWGNLLNGMEGDPAGWSRADHLKLLCAEQPGALVGSPYWRERTGLSEEGLADEVKTWAMSLPGGYLQRQDWQAAQEGLLSTLKAFHMHHPDLPGMPRAQALKQTPSPSLGAAVIEHLLSKDKIKSSGDVLHRSDFKPLSGEAVQTAQAQMLSALKEAGLDPPALQELWRGPEQAFTPILNQLRRDGVVEQVGQRFLHRDTWQDLAEKVRSQGEGTQLDLAFFKDLTGLSRRLLIPLLEHLDAERITKREGEGRVVLP